MTIGDADRTVFIEQEGGRQYFLIRQGRRHEILTPDAFSEYGLSPDDAAPISPEALADITRGPHLPHRWTGWPAGLVGSGREAREASAWGLTGAGLEFEPGDSPFPLPLEAIPRYVGLYSAEELVAKRPHLRLSDIPTIDTACNIEDLRAVERDSLDFIVMCRTIPTSRDPIATIISAIERLKPGGRLIMVVPDKDYSFDAPRPLTSLAHLIADHETPDHFRDAEHHKELHSLSFPSPEGEFEDRWRSTWINVEPIHFHVWDYASFGELMNWLGGKDGLTFTVAWSHPTVQDHGEFYYVVERAS